MNKQFKAMPHFSSEKKEREFWQSNDSTEYVDWSKARRVSFPNLKLTSKPITIRLPEIWIERLKVVAHRMDLPYQTLIKKIIFDGMQS